MRPADGSKNPTNARKVVDFPHPEGPKNVKNSPSLISKFKLSIAIKSPYLI